MDSKNLKKIKFDSKYKENPKVVGENNKIKAFIQETKSKAKKKLDEGPISIYTNLLYEDPSGFIEKLQEMKDVLNVDNDYFDNLETSLFSHYFIALESAKIANKHPDYNVLNDNYLKFLDMFSDKLSLKDSKGNTLLHFLAKNGQVGIIEMILDHFEGKQLINLKETNNKNELVLNYILERSKKENFLRIYEKYAISYDLKTLSENPLFQGILKMLTVYEKDIFEDLQNNLKEKNYDKFVSILENFKKIELTSLIFYQNISFNYFEIFIVNNLDEHLRKFLSLIEERCGENIENLFKDETNILISSIKKSKLSLITLVFDFYLSYKDKIQTKKVLQNRKGMNIIHLLILNRTLNIEEKNSLLNKFRSSLDHTTFTQMINSKDILGNLPFNYALSYLAQLNEIPSAYDALLNELANETKMEVFHQDISKEEANLIFKNKEFNNKLANKKIKNYITHPSLSLCDLNHPQHFIYLTSFLEKFNLLNFFVLDKIYELSVLDLILMKAFDQKILEDTNLYEHLYQSVVKNVKSFSNFDETYCYYLHIDSIINLITRCPIDSEKIDLIISLLATLTSENMTKYKKFKIKKKLIVIKKNKNKKSLPYIDEKLFISLDTFLSNITSINTNFDGILTDRSFPQSKLESAINLTHSEILKSNGGNKNGTNIITKHTKDTQKIFISNNFDNDFLRNDIFKKLFLHKDFIKYINKFEDYQLFSNLIKSYLMASLPFNFYDFLEFMLENLNPLQARYFTELIMSSENLFYKLFNNNPSFLFTNVYGLINVLISINKEKNLGEFIKIVNFIKSHNIYFSVLFDIITYNLLENELKNQCLKKKIKSASKTKDEASYLKILYNKLKIHFPPPNGSLSSNTKVVNIFGIYNVFLLTISQNEKHHKFIQDCNSMFYPINSLNYNSLSRTSLSSQFNMDTINQDISSTILKTAIQKIVEPINENNLHLYNSQVIKIFDKLMVNLNYKMTEILSSEHYRKYIDLFWNVSNYYIDSHVNKDTLYQEQELIIEIIIDMLKLFDKRGLKPDLNESNQVLLLKNFVYNFDVKIEDFKLSEIINSFKNRLKIFKNYISDNFINEFETLISCNESLVIFSKSNNLKCLINKVLEFSFTSKEYEIFPYINYSTFKDIFAKSFSKNSSIEYINVWESLFINNPIRDTEQTIQDIKEFIEDLESRNNVVYIKSGDKKLKKEKLKDFVVFDTNFKNIINSFKLKDIFKLKNKNYHISAISSIFHTVFSDTKHYYFSQNPHIFLEYLNFFDDNDIFILSNQNSSQLFLIIVELFIIVYDTVSKNQEISDKLVHAFNNILSNIVQEINNSERTKLEQYETKDLIYTMSLALKLRSEEDLKRYFTKIFSLKSIFFKDLLLAKSFQTVMILYAIFNDNMEDYKKIEESLKKNINLTEYYNFKKDSHYNEIIVERNKFSKMLKYVSHSNYYYFAIINSSSILLKYFSEFYSLEELKKNYLSKLEEENKLFGLDKTVLLSKNLTIIDEFKDIIQFNDDLYIFIANKLNVNDIFIINHLASTSKFDLNTFVLNCAEKGNNEIFINYFNKFDNENKANIFSRTLFGGNLLHILAKNNNYKLFIYLLENYLNTNESLIDTLILKQYEGNTPLNFAIKNQNMEMYLLLEKYYQSQYILLNLIYDLSFPEILCERIESKKIEMYDTIFTQNDNILFYAGLASLYKKFINKYSNYVTLVTYKKKKEVSKNNIPVDCDEIEKLKLLNNQISMNSLVLSFIFSKPTNLTSNFSRLMDFNEVNNTRIINYFFISFLGINFNLQFYSNLILSPLGLINEHMLFDLLYFSQKRGNTIFDVVKYYDNQNFGNIFNNNNQLSLETVLNTSQIAKLNTITQNDEFNIKINDIKSLFVDNTYIILFKAVNKNYIDLSNLIYMKVLNYSFDYDKIVSIFEDTKFNILSNNEKSSFPLFIFNNFVLTTQQLLSSDRFLWYNFKGISYDHSHNLALLYNYFNNINNELLLRDQNIFSLFFNDFISGNILEILKGQKSFNNLPFWSNVSSIFQKLRNQIRDLSCNKDFQFFLEDNSDKLKFFEYDGHNLNNVFNFIFEEYQQCFTSNCIINKQKIEYNIFDVNISGLKCYYENYYEYLSITNKKFPPSNNQKFNSFINNMSSFINLILNFTSICEEIAYQIRSFYGRLTDNKLIKFNLKNQIEKPNNRLLLDAKNDVKYTLAKVTSKITYKLSFSNMLDHIIDEKKIDQMKVGLVGEFINCLSNVIENKEYSSNIIIPFHIRTDDLSLVDSIMNVGLHSSISNYFSLYFDLIESIFMKSHNLMVSYPDKLLFGNLSLAVDEKEYEIHSAGQNFNQIIELKSLLMDLLLKNGKLSFDIEGKANSKETKLILAFLSNNSGISSPKSKSGKKIKLTEDKKEIGVLDVKIEDIFRNNPHFKLEIEQFINEISNYQIYSTYNYYLDYIDFHKNYENKKNYLAPYVFFGFEYDVNNVFYTNNKFDVFLIDLVEKLSFLREIYMKFPYKITEVNVASFFSIIDNFLTKNQETIQNNHKFNSRIIKSIFCSHKNSEVILIDYLLELVPKDSKVIFNFEESDEKNNLTQCTTQQNSLIDIIFVINNIKVHRDVNEFRITINIYSRNLIEEVLPMYGGLDQIFTKILVSSYNKELCAHYQNDKDLKDLF